jgi:uncharacterized protein
MAVVNIRPVPRTALSAIESAVAGRNTGDGFASGIYSPEQTERTYEECLARADRLLFEGKRVIVDASFRAESQRRRFLELAAELCVPGMLFICRAVAAVVKNRLEKRRNDVSDADWAIYLKAAQRWEPIGPATERSSWVIDTDHDNRPPLNQVVDVLRRCEIWQ